VRHHDAVKRFIDHAGKACNHQGQGIDEEPPP
jgi:hypothetical protein